MSTEAANVDSSGGPGVVGRRSRPLLGGVAVALLFDAIVVVAFAVSGRAEHGGSLDVAGVWSTAWPFLSGLLLAWGVGLIWRHPFAILRGGLVAWAGAVVFGMILRVSFTDGGAALPFVLVATGVLGVGLVGWRLIAMLVRRLG